MLVAAGFLCGKIGLIDREMNRKASDLLLLVISPCLIFSSYQIEFSETLTRNLFIAFLLAVLCFVVQIGIGYALIRKGRKNAPVERMSVIYSNCAFMGIPLIQALYGAEGVLYLTAYVTCFNLMFWTHGIILMSGSCDWRLMAKKLCSPALLSIVIGLTMFLLRIRLPALLLAPIESIGSMTTPLAMLIAGASIASTNLKSCFTNRSIYYVLLIRLLLIPVAAVLVVSLLPVPALPAYVVLTAVACPTGAVCTMLAIRYGQDEGYAAQIFTLTTIVSVVTIPLITMLMGKLI